MRERVVITGAGALTPVGIGIEEYWRNLVAGRGGVGRISRFNPDRLACKIGAEVKGFNPTDYMTPKIVRETDFFIQLALAAAQMALLDSGVDLEKEDPYRVGVVFGTSIGGIVTIVDGQDKMEGRHGSVRISPHFIPKMLTNMAAGQISIHYGLRGPNLTVTTACASGTDAVGNALRLLQRGEADIVIAGGAESLFCALVLAGLYAARAVSTRNDNPDRASRPFDRQRDGMVMGEGAGALILETLEHARRRGAPVLAEPIGYANCGDGYHSMAPAPDGHGEVRCMRKALADAGISPEQVDYINAHGTSTILGDSVETQAIKTVFGSHAYRIPVSSIKGATGHMIAAGGVTELIACVKAIREGVVPPTINQEEPDPECDLDYVPNFAREVKVDIAMNNSFGFGGQNACLVVKKFVG
jgi:3-oxoacyl-[acyl-carrier-protein] synthase II